MFIWAWVAAGRIVGIAEELLSRARGKTMGTQVKFSQLSAKRRMLTDKVTSEAQVAMAGIQAAIQKIDRAHTAVRLANQMAEIERRRFELGMSNLLSVNLREQHSAEAHNLEVGS